jgi:hypothetical protein
MTFSESIRQNEVITELDDAHKLSARESMELSYTSVYILYPFPGDTLVIV